MNTYFILYIYFAIRIVDSPLKYCNITAYQSKNAKYHLITLN